MIKINLKDRASLLKNEALNLLYNKPVKSTMLERIQVLCEVSEIVKDMPQYLKIGKASLLIAEKVSKPVNKNDILLGRIKEVVPSEEEDKYIDSVFLKNNYNLFFPCQFDSGHNTFAWEELVEYGLLGLKEKAQNKLEELKSVDSNKDSIDLLSGKVMIYDSYIKYILDYAVEAENMGLIEEAKICRNITQHAPQNFREAMQLILFVGTFFSAYMTVISALSYGRLDKILLPIYERDIESGVLSEEDAESIIIDFYCKNNLILGRGEHQMATTGDDENNTGWFRNPMYDTPQYVVLGGYVDEKTYNSKETPDNPLTELFLKAYSSKFKNPVLVYRHSKPFINKNYELLCRLVMDNASILNYNDETMIPSFVNFGVEIEDAIEYSVHPCNWPDIAGKHVHIKKYHTNLASIIRDSMIKEKNNSFDSIKDFYEALFKNFEDDFSKVIVGAAGYTADFPNHSAPLMHIDCFSSGGAESIYPAQSGGIKYITLYNQIRYIGSGIDALIALDYLVFKEKKISFSDFVSALENNYEGNEELLLWCKNAPKYGDDSDISNYHTNRLVKGITAVSEEIAKSKLKKNIILVNTAINDSNHRIECASVGATADGRRAGELLSENMSPASRIKNGSVTALMNSVANLPFEHIACGALNIKINSSILKGEKGLDNFKALMKVYLEIGGMQSQWSFVSTDVLRDAQKNPEKYADLLVRVTGYSAIFVDMSKNAQDEMIIRSEMA